ncbi:MAG: DUF2400 family protein [Hymenobacter sp.]
MHVERQARPLGLLTRKLVDWQAAEELTANLRLLDPTGPGEVRLRAVWGGGGWVGRAVSGQPKPILVKIEFRQLISHQNFRKL